MFERIKKMFSEKDEIKKTENLVAFLIILVITLIIINKILSGNKTKLPVKNETNVEMVTDVEKEVVEISSQSDYGLKEELEETLSKISGVRKSTSVTYICRNFKYFTII